MPKQEQRFLEAIKRLHQDQQPVQISTSKFEIWSVLCTIQLACRHPKFNGPTRKIVEHWARHVGGFITANDQDLRMLFEMGWNKQFDEERKEE